MWGAGRYYSSLGEHHYIENELSYAECSEPAVIMEQLNLANITDDLKNGRNAKV